MLNTIEIYHDLKENMDEAAAEKIAAHLGRLYAELRVMVKREDFSDLKGVVKELADAQTRTEQKVEELADAQKRTEQKVEELADAQKRTEQKVEELADAQKRTESAIQELVSAHKGLEKAHNRLAQQVGGLSDTIGGDIEDIAYSLVFRVLSDTFGWQINSLERVWHTWDNKPEEVNIFGKAADPMRPNVTIWIVGEAKHNLTKKELNKFIKQVKRARHHLTGEVFCLCFCYRARPELQQAAQNTGIHLLFSYGKLLYPVQHTP